MILQIVICTLLISVFVILSKKKMLKTSGLGVAELYSGLKSGDIVLFKWKGAPLKNQLVTIFTHVGVILETPNGKMILETHQEGDAIEIGVKTGGVHLHNFTDRVNAYEGDVFIARLKEKHRVPVDVSKRVFEKVEGYKVNIPFYDEYKQHMKKCIVKNICDGCVSLGKRKSMFCSEFVGFCLEELGIFAKGKSYECNVPDDYTRLPQYIRCLVLVKKTNKKIPVTIQ